MSAPLQLTKLVTIRKFQLNSYSRPCDALLLLGFYCEVAKAGRVGFSPELTKPTGRLSGYELFQDTQRDKIVLH